MPFQNTWTQIQQIPIKTKIPNWTADHGYRGKPVTVVDINPHKVTFSSTTAIHEQRVPIDDFRGVYAIWNQYTNHRYRRHHIRDNITRYSRYIIDTFQWLCAQNNGRLP